MEDIRHWMVIDRLLLNDENTEFLLIGTRQLLSKVEPLPLRVEAMDIEPVNCVRNLGAWLDSMLSMETHINKVWRSWILLSQKDWKIPVTRLSSNSYPCVCHKWAGLLL